MFSFHKNAQNKKQEPSFEIIHRLKAHWVISFPYIVLLCAVVGCMFLGYVWYTYLYVDNLSVQEKETYADEKTQENAFDKDQFDAMLQIVHKRQDTFHSLQEEHMDLFYHRTSKSPEYDTQKPVVEKPSKRRKR